MKKVLKVIFSFFLVCISTEINAQSTLSKEYLELINKAKATPHLFGFIGNQNIFNFNRTSTNKIILPLDNMACALPPKDVKYHILLSAPQSYDRSEAAKIPNAVPSLNIVQ